MAWGQKAHTSGAGQGGLGCDGAGLSLEQRPTWTGDMPGLTCLGLPASFFKKGR